MARRKYNTVPSSELLNKITGEPVETMETEVNKVRKKIAKDLERDTDTIERIDVATDGLEDYDEVFGEEESELELEELGYPQNGVPEIISTLKSFVSISVQLQKTRLAAGNRLYAAIATAYGLSNEAKHKAPKKPKIVFDEDGNPIDTSAEKQKKEESKILKELVNEYKIISNAVLNDIYKKPAGNTWDNLDNEFKSLELSKAMMVKKSIIKLLAVPEDHAKIKYLKTFPLYMLTKAFIDFLDMEANHRKQLEYLLKQIPVYKHYLRHVDGVGPTMAAAIISKLDYTKDTVSKWIKYCGMDVVVNAETGEGVGRTNHKEHQVLRSYKKKTGEIDEKWSITYDPWIKAKLLGVLPTCISKSYSKKTEIGKQENIYYNIYLNYRHRIENDPNRQGTKMVTLKDGSTKEYKIFAPGRVHKMANRYMIKWLLIDLYVNWRAIEGLTSREPYQDEKMKNDDGSKHVSKIRTIDFSNPKKPTFVEIPWSEHEDPRYLCSSKFDRSILN